MTTGPIGLTDAAEGQEVRSANGNPPLSGKLVIASHGESKQIMLLVSEPAPGVCHLSAMPMGGPIYVSIRFYLFGAGAAVAVAETGPEWTRWFGERFPMGIGS